MRIAITGAAGRLGAVLHAEMAAAGHEVAALSRTDLDVTGADQVASVMDHLRPQVIINCSAYNAVDAAESEPSLAFSLNAHSVGLLAQTAQALSALLVHYSTDFVFDGLATELYSEESPTAPLSVYGSSKLAGEHEARRAGRHYVLRVESLFGGAGVHGHRASVDAIADTLMAGSPVKAFIDRTVTPSFVPDVARATRALIEGNAPYGLYHCVNSGRTTWYDLAHEVAARLGVSGRIEPVKVADVTTVAPRPSFCALSNRKLLDEGVAMPDWRSAIARHVASRRAQTLEARA